MSTLLQIRQVAHLMEHDMQPAKPHAKEHTNNPVQRPNFRGQGMSKCVIFVVPWNLLRQQQFLAKNIFVPVSVQSEIWVVPWNLSSTALTTRTLTVLIHYDNNNSWQKLFSILNLYWDIFWSLFEIWPIVLVYFSRSFLKYKVLFNDFHMTNTITCLDWDDLLFKK
jgi:hypothetical protein